MLCRELQDSLVNGSWVFSTHSVTSARNNDRWPESPTLAHLGNQKTVHGRRFFSGQHQNREIEFPQIVVRGEWKGICGKRRLNVLKKSLPEHFGHALPGTGAEQLIDKARHAALDISLGYLLPKIGKQIRPEGNRLPILLGLGEFQPCSRIPKNESSDQFWVFLRNFENDGTAARMTQQVDGTERQPLNECTDIPGVLGE